MFKETSYTIVLGSFGIEIKLMGKLFEFIHIFSINLIYLPVNKVKVMCCELLDLRKQFFSKPLTQGIIMNINEEWIVFQ